MARRNGTGNPIECDNFMCIHEGTDKCEDYLREHNQSCKGCENLSCKECQSKFEGTC